MSDRDKSYPLNVDIGAKAEAKLSVNTRVPEESSGRFLDALTDLIRPWSEGRGLKADQIRLQREEVALEICKKARDRLILESVEYRLIPTKTLVPLLEAASLEEPENVDMHEMWANLLASTISTNNAKPRFVGILKELENSQAKLLDELVTHYADLSERPLKDVYEWLEDYCRELRWSNVSQEIENHLKFASSVSIDDVYGKICSLLIKPGCMVGEIIVNEYEADREVVWYTPQYDLDLQILESLGLVENVEARPNTGEVEIILIYSRITELGVSFLHACKNIEFDS